MTAPERPGLSVPASAWLRSLAAEATPGPWRTRKSGLGIDGTGAFVVCTLDGAADDPRMKEDARLIALAPDLAVLCADAIDTLEATRDFLPPALHDSTADPFHPGNMVAPLLARFAALQPDNTEEEQT